MTLRSVGFLVLLTLLAAWRGDISPSTLRCGLNLVTLGATKSEVLHKCGEPTNIEYWEEEIIRRDFYRNIPDETHGPKQEPFFIRETVAVEEWEYNYGADRFIRYLRFGNGRLRRITFGDYGY